MADKQQVNAALPSIVVEALKAQAKAKGISVNQLMLTLTADKMGVDISNLPESKKGKPSAYATAGLNAKETEAAKALVVEYDKASHKANIAKAIDVIKQRRTVRNAR